MEADTTLVEEMELMQEMKRQGALEPPALQPIMSAPTTSGRGGGDTPKPKSRRPPTSLGVLNEDDQAFSAAPFSFRDAAEQVRDWTGKNRLGKIDG